MCIVNIWTPPVFNEAKVDMEYFVSQDTPPLVQIACPEDWTESEISGISRTCVSLSKSGAGTTWHTIWTSSSSKAMDCEDNTVDIVLGELKPPVYDR